MKSFSFRNTQFDLLTLNITGDRLKLLPISERFAPDIYREFTDEVTTFMIPSPTSNIEETKNFIAASRDGMKAGYNLQFVIVSKAKEFLGNCGLHGKNKVRNPELGIWLKKGASGRGYGREAIHTLVNWSRDNLDLDYFIYPVDRRNIASRKIPESLGGQIIEESEIVNQKGKTLDYLVYRIEASNRLK